MAEMDQPPSPWENLDGDELLELARAAGIDVAELQADTSITGVLEATDSITDASGDTHTGELADRDGDDLTPNTIDFTTSITDADDNTVTSLSDPVRVTEEASTFAETGVSITHNNTEEVDGSLYLISSLIIDDFEDNDITTKSSKWDGWNGETSQLTAQNGTVINGNYSGEFTATDQYPEVTTERLSNTTNSAVGSFIIDNDSGNSSYSATPAAIYTKAGVRLGILQFRDNNGEVNWFNGSSVQIDSSWSVNTVIDFELNFDFPNDEVTIFLNGVNKGTYGLENSASGWGQLRVEASTTSSQTKHLYFDGYTEGANATSGDALVSFDSGVPYDIDSWDLATFQRTLDGETVTIDVEDSNGNVLKSDISKDTDISDIATSTDVKLRANISRNDTANNPTVDYVARRYTR